MKAVAAQARQPRDTTADPLFEPISLGPVALRNRIVKAAMATNLATSDGHVTEQMLDHYAEVSKGGAGLVVVEFCAVDDIASVSWPRQLRVHDDKHVDGLSRLARTIHDGGARAALQLCHGGTQRLCDGPRWVPSTRDEPGEHVPDDVELDALVLAFARAARRAKRAGFDLVEVHAAHGYLLSEFLSADTNRRTDEHGGTLDSRAFLLLRIARVIARCRIPMMVRLNGSDLRFGGTTPDDATSTALALEKAGACAIHVSAGTYESRHLRSTPSYADRGNLVDFAARIRSRAGVPVIASGGLSDPDELRALLRAGRADLVSMARQLLADPRWPAEVRSGRGQSVRPCVRCNRCVQDGLRAVPVRCDVRPGDETSLTATARPRRIVVVGGGPAGVEAAHLLALRGHEVRLLEASAELGGALRAADRLGLKSDLRVFLRHHLDKLRASAATVELNHRVLPSEVGSLDADHLVVATGAVPLDSFCPSALPALNALSCNEGLGDRVAVIGGGITGCETALNLAREGRTVTLFERGHELAAGLEPSNRNWLLDSLRHEQVQLQLGVDVLKVDHGVPHDHRGPCGPVQDTVLSAVGVRPDDSMVVAAQAAGIPVHAIGDCTTPGDLGAALRAAWDVALAL